MTLKEHYVVLSKLNTQGDLVKGQHIKVKGQHISY